MYAIIETGGKQYNQKCPNGVYSFHLLLNVCKNCAKIVKLGIENTSLLDFFVELYFTQIKEGEFLSGSQAVTTEMAP